MKNNEFNENSESHEFNEDKREEYYSNDAIEALGNENYNEYHKIIETNEIETNDTELDINENKLKKVISNQFNINSTANRITTEDITLQSINEKGSNFNQLFTNEKGIKRSKTNATSINYDYQVTSPFVITKKQRTYVNIESTKSTDTNNLFNKNEKRINNINYNENTIESLYQTHININQSIENTNSSMNFSIKLFNIIQSFDVMNLSIIERNQM